VVGFSQKLGGNDRRTCWLWWGWSSSFYWLRILVWKNGIICLWKCCIRQQKLGGKYKNRGRFQPEIREGMTGAPVDAGEGDARGLPVQHVGAVDAAQVAHGVQAVQGARVLQHTHVEHNLHLQCRVQAGVARLRPPKCKPDIYRCLESTGRIH